MCCAVQRCEALADYDVVQEEPKKTEKKEEPKKVSCTSRVALHASHLTLALYQKTEEPKKKAEEPKKARLTSRISFHYCAHHASLPITVHT